jgi:hypothetical protein
VKRQFPLFISSLQQQNEPGTESVNSCQLLMSAKPRTMREAQGMMRGLAGAIALPDGFWSEHWKNADSSIFQFCEGKGSVQLLAVCGQTVSASDRCPRIF